MDNDTRWGSVAAMVEYGLENHDSIDMYCKEQSALADDTLNDEDWVELQTVFSTFKAPTDFAGDEDSSPIQKIDETRTI
jgi:hypothetical protein